MVAQMRWLSLSRAERDQDSEADSALRALTDAVAIQRGVPEAVHIAFACGCTQRQLNRAIWAGWTRSGARWMH